MFTKKETIGWSVRNRHYRVRSQRTAVVLFTIDTVGNALFGLFRRRCPPGLHRIGIIQMNHIGDIILSAYFVDRLRVTFPQAHITLIVRDSLRQVATLISGVDEVLGIPIGKHYHSHTGWINRLKTCIRSRKRFDIAFELGGDPRDILMARLLSSYSVGFGVRGLGFLLDKPVQWSRSYNRHIVEVQGDLARIIAKSSDVPFQSGLNIPSEVQRKTHATLEHLGLQNDAFILVQMSSSARNREWPVEHWLRLLRRLCEHFPIVTADLDEKKYTPLAAALPAGRFFALQLSIAEYAAVTARSKLVITVETFAGHLGARTGIPVVCLHSGTTLATEWGPYATNALVLQDKSCPQYPCGRLVCPFAHPSPCMYTIEVQKVATAIESVLRSRV